MDDITKTQNNPLGGGLGGQSGGWSDTGRDVVNPADDAQNDDVASDLNPLPASGQGADFDDQDDLDLTGSSAEDDANYAEVDDDDDILPPDTTHPEIGNDRDGRIIQDPMMDEDPAEDPEDDSYLAVR
jgi:hypothetical protein